MSRNRIFWLTGEPIHLPECEPRLGKSDRALALIFAALLAAMFGFAVLV